MRLKHYGIKISDEAKYKELKGDGGEWLLHHDCIYMGDKPLGRVEWCNYEGQDPYWDVTFWHPPYIHARIEDVPYHKWMVELTNLIAKNLDGEDET